MLLKFGHDVVAAVIVVDDDGVDDVESFLVGNEVLMGLMRMKKQQSLGINFQDEEGISILHY